MRPWAGAIKRESKSSSISAWLSSGDKEKAASKVENKNYRDSWGSKKRDSNDFDPIYENKSKKSRVDDEVSNLLEDEPQVAEDYLAEKLLKAREETIAISVGQHNVLDLIIKRKSVFFTGAAGTGKSYILKILQDVLSLLNQRDKIAFTAPTGVAACNIQGMTIHSWAGIGVINDFSPGSIEQCIYRVNKQAQKRWANTEILVIDEISMLSAELFDVLSLVGQRYRRDDRPFGGVQLILCGDFFQLPPVGIGRSCKFCFESATWKAILNGVDGAMVVLDKVFRQKDSTFLTILNDMRRGVVTPSSSRLLYEKVAAYQAQQIAEENGKAAGTSISLKTRYTKLFSTNKDVDVINETEFKKLRDPVTYTASDFHIDEGAYNTLKSGTKAAETLKLAVGAQVMLLKNLDTSLGLVNGARGVVLRFRKSQQGDSSVPRVPEVRFSVRLANGEVNMFEHVIEMEEFKIMDGDRALATRKQLPLMLAWAISIHKSQGMTIPKLEVSFHRIFECGQAYVALSRATDLDGLSLSCFQVSSVKAHDKVIRFYREHMGYIEDRIHSDEATIRIKMGELMDAYENHSISFRADRIVEEKTNEDNWIAPTKPRSSPNGSTNSFVSVSVNVPSGLMVNSLPLSNMSSSSSSNNGSNVSAASDGAIVTPNYVGKLMVDEYEAHDDMDSATMKPVRASSKPDFSRFTCSDSVPFAVKQMTLAVDHQSVSVSSNPSIQVTPLVVEKTVFAVGAPLKRHVTPPPKDNSFVDLSDDSNDGVNVMSSNVDSASNAATVVAATSCTSSTNSSFTNKLDSHIRHVIKGTSTEAVSFADLYFTSSKPKSSSIVAHNVSKSSLLPTTSKSGTRQELQSASISTTSSYIQRIKTPGNMHIPLSSSRVVNAASSHPIGSHPCSSSNIGSSTVISEVTSATRQPNDLSDSVKQRIEANRLEAIRKRDLARKQNEENEMRMVSKLQAGDDW